MASKKYDLSVKVGEYTNSNGETKGRYENIGAVMVGDDGSPFVMIKKTFNPAGVVSDRDSVLVSCFAPKQQQQQPQQQPQNNFDQDVPF